MESTPTLIAVDPKALRGIEEKLDQIISDRENQKGYTSANEVEWITTKDFMNAVSIKAYNTFKKIKSKMPDSVIREINGRIYVHRGTIRKYFEGAYND